ncbi:hypothetical protein DSL72_003383 [Monilinia vaccinii-corymbosi]|uniref:STAS domain-containing protein n=1 Tax=Monilinia vaccinii-corymbosi TaxID=61207 RepID=A0A8A3P5S6_9HELO|nr:hypothetical protein DSL72_003383 [Monilinia vaccinii-corymbosi]
MGIVADKLHGIKEAFKNDENFSRGRRGVVRGLKALPSSTGRYLLRKVPVVRWIPNYSPKWLVDDIVAGVTVALILVPQALASATIAGVPLEQGLFASWLPSAIYFFMGTSKDIATGPTTSLSLLTNAVVLSITAEDLPIPPALIASALSFSIGVMFLLLGLLNLGWILNFVSVPMLVGFQMAAAVIICQGQLPLILGESGVGLNFTTQMPEIIQNIKTTQPLSLAVGAGSIVIIVLLKFVGKKWGEGSTIIRVLSNLRNAFVIVVFTAVSFLVNKNLIIPRFPIAGTLPQGIQAPQAPSKIVLFVATKAMPVFLAAAAEHLIFAKSFARQHKYEVDESQELVFLGTANMVNGVFGGMPVSGSLSLTAINSSTGVRSPFGGLFSSGLVFLAINAISDQFKWIPTAATSAIILISVAEILPPGSTIGTFWKRSFADFIGFIIVMNGALVAGLGTAIGLGVLYMIVYTLLRTLFTSISPLRPLDIENRYNFNDLDKRRGSLPGGTVPYGTEVITFETPIIYLNAERIKKDILDTIWAKYAPDPCETTEQRGWSDNRTRQIAALRRRTSVDRPLTYLPKLEVLVLRFSCVPVIDTSGLTYLQDLKDKIIEYSGESVEIRLVGINAAVQKKFQRAGWPLGTWKESQIGLPAGVDIIFEDLHDAVSMPRSVRASMNVQTFDYEGYEK